ncbi:MAG: membrane protein insertase YidC, partial [Rickettsiales bacterium]|nr:membrane protein insertase YidC [Rickettsiales bacterium]
MLNQDEPDYRRIFLAVALSAIVLIYWQITVEWPRRQELAQFASQQEKKKVQEKANYAKALPAPGKEGEDNPALSREERLKQSPRVVIRSEKIAGSIALKGARFDDLSLQRYRTEVAPDAPKVTLFSPNGDAHGYFAHIGWLAGDAGLKTPDQNTLWKADKTELTPGSTVNLRWDNGQGVTFILAIALDENYMFSIDQKVENTGNAPISVMPYAYLNRTYEIPGTAAFLHEGPLGVINDALEEVTYDTLKEKGNNTFENATGWFGITDH